MRNLNTLQSKEACLIRIGNYRVFYTIDEEEHLVFLRDLNLLLKYDLVHRQTVLDVLIDDQVYRMATTNRQNLFDHVLGCRTQLRHYVTPFYLTVSTVNSFTTHLSMANHP